MIISSICGGLGNQLFRYAYTRKVLHDRGDSERLLLKFIGKRTSNHSGGDELGNFNVVEYETITKNTVLTYGSVMQIFIYHLYGFDRKIISMFLNEERAEKRKNWWYKFMRKKGLVFCDHTQNDAIIETPKTKNVIISGNFENKFFFDDIKDLLRKELSPKHPLMEKNKQLYDIIVGGNSVCVHFRRGDYVDDERYRRTHYLCDENYMFKAIEKIKSKVENPVFVFFSNDIEWVKDHIHIDSPCYFESGSDPVWETFRLMSSCKHFIISNSTLSWWSQYLSNNPEKIVISPNIWYRSKIRSYLISDEFDTIEV